ncbi:MAG: hypothetical protein K0Q62_10 [Phenylobacterium sp.]|jgi:hypothetical protein|nr:hypothetical protein [Phenylobacterium sp.]
MTKLKLTTIEDDTPVKLTLELCSSSSPLESLRRFAGRQAGVHALGAPLNDGVNAGGVGWRDQGQNELHPKGLGQGGSYTAALRSGLCVVEGA